MLWIIGIGACDLIEYGWFGWHGRFQVQREEPAGGKGDLLGSAGDIRHADRERPVG